MAVEREQVRVADRAAWRAWLEEHHATSPGVWLVLPKARSGLPGPSYDDVVEEALCFGWIDSTAGAVDEDHGRLLFTRRKKGSGWAGSNKARVARLTEAGLMAPAGLAAVAAAQADGSWTVLDAVEALEEPDDLRAALDAVPVARHHFNGFPPSARKMILGWIATAKRPETRARRITTTVEQAAQGIRANQ